MTNVPAILDCILLVDDDHDCNFFLQRLIKKLDCAKEIRIALDGDSALALLEEMKDQHIPAPELIFLDVYMPRVSGFQFVRKFQELKLDGKDKTKIVLMTALKNPEEEVEAQQNPLISAYIQKYVDENSLIKILSQFGLAEA